MGVPIRAASEFAGTFALVFAGTGAIVVDAHTGGLPGPVGVALAFGLVVATMVLAIGDLSGTHLNPAVSLPSSAPRPSRCRSAPASPSRSPSASCWCS